MQVCVAYVLCNTDGKSGRASPHLACWHTEVDYAIVEANILVDPRKLRIGRKRCLRARRVLELKWQLGRRAADAEELMDLRRGWSEGGWSEGDPCEGLRIRAAL